MELTSNTSVSLQQSLLARARLASMGLRVARPSTHKRVAIDKVVAMPLIVNFMMTKILVQIFQSKG